MRFSVHIARIQMSAGRGFLFEHPYTASSWHTTELAELKQEQNVYEVRVDMCAFGLVTKEGVPALKPTLLLTNIESLANALGRRCNGKHSQHQPLVGGRAAAAAVYTQQFVDCILRALKRHVQCRPEGTPPEDYWTMSSTHLTRHHVQPRWALFNPQNVTTKPCSESQLGDRRVSTNKSDNNHTQVLHDNWRSDRSHPTWTCPWTGTTEFELVEPFVCPASASMSSTATWIAASGAHPLHSYVVEESKFQDEWYEIISAFPTHRILEGGGRAGDGSSTSTASSSSRSTTRGAAASTSTSSSTASRPRMSTSPLPPTSVDQPRRRPSPLPSIAEVKGEDALEDQLDAEVERAGQELRRPGPAHEPDVGEVSLHPELRRELYRLHRNLGHSDRQTFLRALRHANCRKEALEWVRSRFQCPICERKQKPKSQRPGHLTQSLPFNRVVGVDLMFYEDHVLLNMLDWGTDLQIVVEVEDKRAQTVCTAFMVQWVAHYGPPSLVIADQGKEFVSEEFGGRLGEHGISVHYTDVRSPWQNARTERAGGSFKTRLETIIHETTATEEEFLLVLAETCAAHNRYYNRAGYSPYQRTFGVNPRLPASLLSDDALDRDLLREGAGDEVRRVWEIRDAAAAAWMRSQDTEAIKRSLRTTTRTADMKELKVGDTVFVWRHTAVYKGWTGPGIVVAINSNERSLWISLRGYLVKASREQVRAATPEEFLGVELVQELSSALLEDVETGQLRNYRDVQAEGPPDELPQELRPEPELPVVQPPLVPDPDVPMEVVPEDPETPQLEQTFDEDDLMEPETPVPVPPSTAEESTRAPTVQDVETMEHDEPPVPTTTSPTPRSMTTPRRTVRVDEGIGGSASFGPMPGQRTSRSSMPYPFSQPGLAPWPTSGMGNQYYNVLSEEKEINQVFWKYQKSQDLHIPQAINEETFVLKDAYGLFDQDFKHMFISKAKESPGQVVFKRLPEEQAPAFRAARDKEIKSLIDSGAIKILSVDDSLKFLKERPEHVLESKFVDRWKPTEKFGVLPSDYHTPGFRPHKHPGLSAKSRWCVVGWQDPMIHEIERAAPTPLTSSMYLFLQVCASRKWKARARDAKTAFLQSKPTTRKNKLCCFMPKDMTFPGFDSRQLIQLETEVYGLVSGPAWWRRSFLEYCVTNLRYRINPYDRCVLSLDGPEAREGEDPTKIKTKGLMIIEVDDILEAGDDDHMSKMKVLAEKVRFGKIEELNQPDGKGAGYAGRRIQQWDDFSFSYHMQDYVDNRLKPLTLHRKVLKKDAEHVKLNPEETQALRAVVAAINWTAREGRPDAAATASILSGVFPEPTVQHLYQVNDAINHLKQNHVTIKIHAIPEEQLRYLVIADSSFDPSGKTKPQHGWLQGLTTSELNAGRVAPFSLISWRSRRLRRKAGSTTLCEAISLSTALGALEKQSAVLSSMRFSRFDPKTAVGSSEVQLGLRGPPTVIASEDAQYNDPSALAIVDAKSVFDGASSEQAQGEDERTALEIAVIQESLSALSGRLRWVPHNLNAADGLTKLLEKAHIQPLMTLLRTHHLRIEEEKDVIAREKQSDLRMKSRH